MLALAGRRQGERDRLVVGVEQDSSVSPTIGSPRSSTSPIRSPASRTPRHLTKPGVPGLVGHLLARRVEPGDVLDVRAADRPALEELPPLEDRLAPARCTISLRTNSRNCLLLGRRAPSRARSARCPGSRRCCCPSACGPARRRRRIIGTPCDSSSVAMRFRFCRSRSAMIAGSSVGPSAPQFQLLLSLAPSLLSSPLASLCLSL